MSDQPTATPQLTPELVSMAIELGILDASLPALQSVIEARIEILANQKRYALVAGQQFIVTNCRPKKWNGVAVTFVKHDGIWLVCSVTPEMQRHLGCSATIRLRTVHVGTVFA